MNNHTAPTATVRTIDLPGSLPVTYTDLGTGTEGAMLVLHGGGGPRTVAGLAAALATRSRVIVPVHPGFDGTPRPESTDSIADLATAYLDLLDALGLTGVTVIGNSVGGWIAAEMAVRDNHGRLAGLAILNGTGIHAEPGEEQVLDVRTINPAKIGELSFANAAFRPDFSTFTPEQLAAGAANQQALAVYGGEHFTFDPKLRGRLHRVEVPALVVWGTEDRVAPLGYGRAFAGAFPKGRLIEIPEAGHFPNIEQPDATLAALRKLASTVTAR
jgi:pimeloyl-ACP methyl ester carboxylesterase